ncbi:hypothetical protein FA048_01385 [Pedobacter polaris]|uniref:Uncharacterized protein n=1 Tax=Pedobacter polaris TaxID=2571273 RepID=A0A4U1CT33_9SPHI|nr:hypothetical protein [Pedobacter polaris]TKC12301.1 hypothetical protein FA048_01385 [Pedobacter polaris]
MSLKVTPNTLIIKHSKILMLVFSLLCSSIYSYAQKDKKNVYFLVDTLNIPKNLRSIEIKDGYEVGYTFFCMCLPAIDQSRPYDNLIYTFLNSKSAKLNLTDKKPNVSYISWKEFLNLATRPKFFEDNYNLYITEALPDNKYRTNKVELRRISITNTTQKIEN